MLRLPTICLLCHQYHRDKYAVCSKCLAELPVLGPACPTCANPCADQMDSNHDQARARLPCGKCLTDKPYLDQVVAPYLFVEPLRTLMHTFKYREGLYLSDLITYLMLNSEHNTLNATECLIPIPMHSKRLKQRGFNQAAILAHKISRARNIPCKFNVCKKTRNTTPQAELTAKEREHNLKDAFKASYLTHTNVTLIDDLLTTGHTANEVAKTLKEQGVRTVNLWCCARTVCL